MSAQKRSDLAQELETWWAEKAQDEAMQVIPKAVEYGANSMIGLGQAMARIAGRRVDDAEAIELACMFYIEGKIGRWIDAVAAGQKVSDDTIHDIGVYARMVQRVRDVGSWPGTAASNVDPEGLF